MNERDRLIELIVDAENELVRERPYTDALTRIERIADHLLANGVIVPPVKVGDTVFCFDDIREGEATGAFALLVKQVYVDSRGCKIYAEGAWWSAVLSPDDFGKTVFLTREEAEQALKERT